MEIVVHYPGDKHSLNTLYEQIAAQHGEFVYSYLNKLDLPMEQKAAIITGIERRNSNAMPVTDPTGPNHDPCRNIGCKKI